jgi:hypothetical protein
MVGKVTIEVTGVREIEAALKELGATAANRIARSALNRSATPIVKRAKRACSGRHGRASQGDHQAAAAAASRVGSADDPDRDREAYKSAGVFSGVRYGAHGCAAVPSAELGRAGA